MTRPKLCVTDSVKNAPVFLRLLFLVVEIDRLVVIAEIFTHVPVSHDGAFAMRVVDGIDLLFPCEALFRHQISVHQYNTRQKSRPGIGETEIFREQRNVSTKDCR